MPNHVNQIDVAIVGAGIVGLAHALAAARKGNRVAVFERNLPVMGASIRNFGMVWPIGQPAGLLLNRAMRSREIWLEVSAKAGFHADPCGSLHLAYRDDERAVLEEFVALTAGQNRQVQLITPGAARQISPAVVTEGLQAALWSATEVIVDPRAAIHALPQFLTETYGVDFHFGRVVTDISAPAFVAGGDRWTADQIILCSGTDFETLYPVIYQASGITKVKLQMMRTVPQPNQWRLGAALAAGLTLTHYAAFADCPTLPRLKTRIATETPHFPDWGIHVMASQNQAGELTIGDSHEYGLNPDPFDREFINRYVLDYFHKFAQIPDPRIAETWHGVYAKLAGKTELVVSPEPGVTIVNAPGGAGMTLSFGLAEEVLTQLDAGVSFNQPLSV